VSPEARGESDVELMRRCQADSEEAFAELIRRYQDPLVNFFRRMGVYQDAEDLVQETFLRMFRYRKRYKPTASLRTFLYRLAGQVRVDYLRKQKRYKDLKDAWPGREAVVEPVDAAETAAAMEALAGLPDAMRQVVVLRIFHGLSYAEIGEACGTPLGTVKSRMFHALRALRQALNNGNDTT
jgi:RNA polymerase sigma-70 factor (ECF subfamily)